jgi:ribonuclease HII
MRIAPDDCLQLSLAELKDLFLVRGEPAPAGLIKALEGDTRRGAQSLARQLRARQSKNRAEGHRLRNLLEYERELWEGG